MNAEEMQVTMNDDESRHIRPLRVIGWLSLGLGIATVGLLIGRELRGRYKFKRRTPYDFYAHASAQRSSDFPVGI